MGLQIFLPFFKYRMERRKRNVDRIVTKLGMILTDNGSKYRIIDIYLYLGGNEKGGNE